MKITIKTSNPKKDRKQLLDNFIRASTKYSWDKNCMKEELKKILNK